MSATDVCHVSISGLVYYHVASGNAVIAIDLARLSKI
jgi:hypothetical protein